MTPDSKANKARKAGAERERTISDEYKIERESDADLAESDFSDLNENELTVPPGQKPVNTLEHMVQESDVHDLVLPPSELPDDSCKKELFRDQEGEEKPRPAVVRRGRAFSNIMSAVHGAVEQTTPEPSEIEKAVHTAVEQTEGETAESESEPEPPEDKQKPKNQTG